MYIKFSEWLEHRDTALYTEISKKKKALAILPLLAGLGLGGYHYGLKAKPYEEEPPVLVQKIKAENDLLE